MVQWVPGDSEKEQTVNLGGWVGGEDTRKSERKGGEGRAPRALMFRGKLEVSSHARRGAYMRMRADCEPRSAPWAEHLKRGSEQMLWVQESRCTVLLKAGSP